MRRIRTRFRDLYLAHKGKKEGETLYMKSCDFQIKSHDPITRLEIKSRDLNEMMCAQIKN